MRKPRTITFAAVTVEYRIFRDKSVSERFPWHLELNGEHWNSYIDQPSAYADAVEVINAHYRPKEIRILT